MLKKESYFLYYKNDINYMKILLIKNNGFA